MSSPFKKSGRLELGREYPPKWETGDFEAMISEMMEEMRELYPAGEMPRQAHPKLHGLLKAEFIIEKDLPEHLRVGVFAKEATYGAFVRLSNASSQPQPDSKGDVRGMAIKVVGVPGEKLIPDEACAVTQDFVLISSETFISRNVRQFNRTIKAISSNNKLIFLLFALNPINWGVLFRSIRAFCKPGSVLEIPYYSTTPYQFGELSAAVKYQCLPRNARNIDPPDNPTDDFLRYQMVEHLKHEAKYFDFYVQFQEDPYKMPIEDPTVKWTSLPQKVATLYIPIQEFDTDVNNDFGQNLSFTPWHSLPEHRPLGGFNRARRYVYEAMSKFRHEANQAPMFEPDSMNVPK